MLAFTFVSAVLKSPERDVCDLQMLAAVAQVGEDPTAGTTESFLSRSLRWWTF
jgi:hypothetical protein